MEDDRNRQHENKSTERTDVDDQIDDVMPVPSDDYSPGADEVDGQMDTILPKPDSEPHPDDDDASTREDLEVDTELDEVDSTIDVEPETAPEPPDDGSDLSYLDDFVDEESPEAGNEPEPSSPTNETDLPTDDEVMEIAGERVSWEAVNDQASSEDDVEPINQDSEFIGSTYTSTPANDADQKNVKQPEDHDGKVETPVADHQCPACGAVIGKSPYCPQCGTDQYPESRLGSMLQPLLSWSRPQAIRAVLMIGALLALGSLLSDSGTTALIVSGLIMPVVLLVRISLQIQLHADTGWIQMGILTIIGFVIGLPLAWFGARMVSQQWFETGVFNFGAAGYGGNFAEVAGVAPFFVWLVVGLLIPVILMLVIGAVPTASRMVMNLAPKETSGIMLSSGVAAGYVAASAVIFYQPLYDELVPRMTTSQWTLTIFGLAVIRPPVWIFGGAMIGAVVWRYLRTASPASIMIPAILAAVIPLGFSILSLAAGPAGHWAETVVGIEFAIAAVFFYQRFMNTAIRNDAAINQK